MVDVNKWSELERQILLRLNKAADDVGKVGEQQLKNSMDCMIYDTPEPYAYERTEELKNSAVYSKESIPNGVQVDIYNDTTQIHPYPGYNEEKWLPRHQTLSGEDVSAYIPEYVVTGSGGHFNMTPRDYFKDAEEKLKNGLIEKAIKEGLRKNGLGGI